MQLAHTTCAYSKRMPWEARRSRFGDVSASLQPKEPSESALRSSAVMIRAFGVSAAYTSAAHDVIDANVIANARNKGSNFTLVVACAGWAFVLLSRVAAISRSRGREPTVRARAYIYRAARRRPTFVSPLRGL